MSLPEVEYSPQLHQGRMSSALLRHQARMMLYLDGLLLDFLPDLPPLCFASLQNSH